MSRIIVCLALFVVFCAARPAMRVKEYRTKWITGLKINTTNVTLRADAFVPEPVSQQGFNDPLYANDTFPLIIFPNSWGVPQIEYVLKALSFGERGYVALEYETRGWYLSGGEIDCAGPLDRQDAEDVLTWALSMGTEWRINPNKVAFAGISYGAGLSLMMSKDPRVTTVVSMSGWGNLTGGLDFQESPNTVWTYILDLAAKLVGHPSKELTAFTKMLEEHKHTAEVKAFADARSPISFLDDINARNVPIFLSNNMQDRIFFPQAQMEAFWNRLTVPKFMLMNNGIHAEPEAFGLVDVPHNYIWNKAMKWLDYWLKDEHSNGMMSEPKFQIEVGQSVFSGNYQKYDDWPVPANSSVKSYTMFFGERKDDKFGTLKAAASTADSTKDTIHFTKEPSLTIGVPVITPLVNSIGIPHTKELLLSNSKDSIIYRSDPLPQGMRVCGVPQMDLTFTPSSERWQLYGFMYAVDLLDIGTMVSEVAVTHWDSFNGNTARKTAIKKAKFRTLCYDFPADSRIAVGFVLYNQLFSPANSSSSFQVAMNYGAEASITLPWEQRP